jgi:putative transposase
MRIIMSTGFGRSVRWDHLYLASESTMYRLQRRLGLRATRPAVTRSHVTRSSTVHCATGPNQVRSWDITWLPTTTRGRYLYPLPGPRRVEPAHRRLVGRGERDRGAAAELIRGICADSGVDPHGLVLHSDNGKPMRGSTMVATLQWLGIVPSFSRPHVSDDNLYSEALFRTLKHTPAYPRRLFAGADAARRWVAGFVSWYNREHRHSAIRYVTPDQRHAGLDGAVLAQRRRLYERARRANPERWTRGVRNWSPVGAVLLNPEPGHQVAA